MPAAELKAYTIDLMNNEHDAQYKQDTLYLLCKVRESLDLGDMWVQEDVIEAAIEEWKISKTHRRTKQ